VRRLGAAFYRLPSPAASAEAGRTLGVGVGVAVGVTVGVTIGVAVGVAVAVGVGLDVGVGVGVGLDCAQYLPPVLVGVLLTLSSIPPHTIISLPVQTAV